MTIIDYPKDDDVDILFRESTGRTTHDDPSLVDRLQESLGCSTCITSDG